MGSLFGVRPSGGRLGDAELAAERLLELGGPEPRGVAAGPLAEVKPCEQICRRRRLRIGRGGDLADVLPDPVGVDTAVIVQKRLQIESGKERVDLVVAEPTGGSAPELSGNKPRAIGRGGLRLRLSDSISNRSLLLAHPLLPKLLRLGLELL